VETTCTRRLLKIFGRGKKFIKENMQMNFLILFLKWKTGMLFILKKRIFLKEMNKYSTALSSITGGRAFYTMKFAKYDKVPPEIQDQLLKEYEKQQEADN